MKTKTDYKSILIEINILTIAIAIIAVAVYFFLVPSHTSISSMSGLGIVLSNFVPLPLSAITMILNVVLLIIGFFSKTHISKRRKYEKEKHYVILWI